MRTIWHPTKWRLKGDSPMHVAYHAGHMKVIKMLGMNGFDVQQRGRVSYFDSDFVFKCLTCSFKSHSQKLKCRWASY